ncbi:hypothetical protein A6A40_17325 (plasmid) [Azospirillum humicireducens]|uniref:Uncharacterized protein n=1 Tax=Azospirillum humicireducens TaxID=1226968 RepID=A0A2R4VQT1_9PROT|nr:hypothetical protein [Azospirillum humicireducens]AWB06813.1 hypothetical protein A6A40_17325 [Azospirillum humicireducens]
MTTLPSYPVHWDHKTILAAVETAFGAGSAGLTGADAVRLWDVTWTPLEADSKELPYVKPFNGANASILLNRRSKLSFKVALVGAGTGGTGIPCWDPFMRAAGAVRAQVAATPAATIAATATKTSGAGAFTFARTTAFGGVLPRVATLTCTTGGGSGVAAFTVSSPAVGATPAYNQVGVVMTTGTPFALPGGAVITPSAIGTPFAAGDIFTIALTPAGCTYTPSSDRAGHKSLELLLTLPDPEDDTKAQRWRMLGGRCAIKATGAADDYPYWEVEVTADYAAPVLGIEIEPVYTAWPDPLVVGTENTPVARLFGNDVVLETFGFDAGNTVEYVSRVGRKGARIQDAKASFTAKIEAPSMSSVDFFALCTSRAFGEFMVQHGVAAGEAVVLSTGRWQLDPPKPGESKKDFMFDLSGKAVPLTEGTDWSIFASAAA